MATTTNVPSSNFEDLQRDVQDTTRFSNGVSQYTNRVGKVIRPIPLVSDEIESNAASVSTATTTALSSITSDSASVSSAASDALTTGIPNAINSLGLQYPPIAYTSGLTLDSYVKTYEQGGSIYLWGGALGTTTTGAFDEGDWQPLQGDLQLRRDVALFDTLSDLIANTYDYGAGKSIKVNGESTVGDGGDGIWTSQATAGLTPNQTPVDRASWEMVDGAGRLWSFSPTNSRVVSPKSFGSINDGSTSDDVPTQIAIDYLANIGGGIVFLNDNQWALEGVEILNDNIAIVGLGRYATNVKYIGDPATTNTVAAFSLGQSKTGSGSLIPVSGCIIKGMTIDGNRAGGAVGGGIRVTVFDGLLIEDVEIKDCYGNYGFGIVGTGASPRNDIVVRDCAAFRCGADGLDIKASLTNCIIDNFESAGHADETGGDSVGLDIRGQYVTVRNARIYDCIEYGLRVRINSGEEDGDGDWETTENARVNVEDCVFYNNRDNVSLSSPADSVVNCINLSSRLATRYGVVTGGSGVVNIIGGSTTENLTGILPSEIGKLSMTNFSISRNTQDGLVGGSTASIKMIGGEISGNGRFGISQAGTPTGTRWLFDGVNIDGNLTNYASTSGSAEGLIEFMGCENINAVSRGVQVAEAPMLLKFNGGQITGNAVNIHSINANSNFCSVNGIVNKAKGTETFSVGSTGKKAISITHGLSFTPSLQDLSISIGRSTNVDDYGIDWFRVVGANSTIFTVEVFVGSASANASAEAFLLWKSEVRCN